MTVKPNVKPQETYNDDFGIVTGQGALRLERLLPGPVERVWAYLTEKDKCAQWLGAIDIDLKKGGNIALHFDHAALTPHDEKTPEEYSKEECAVVTGKVTRYEPNKILGYTWNWGEESSEVIFELEPQDDKVLLRIDHRNIESKDDMACIGGGWHTHVGILRDKLLGRTPVPFWAAFEQLRPQYESLIKGE